MEEVRKRGSCMSEEHLVTFSPYHNFVGYLKKCKEFETDALVQSWPLSGWQCDLVALTKDPLLPSKSKLEYLTTA